MEKRENRGIKDKSLSLLLSIILVFSILGVVVFSVARQISAEMSASAVSNLSESLDLIKCTIEAIMKKEAEYQKLMAQELVVIQDPEEDLSDFGRRRGRDLQHRGSFFRGRAGFFFWRNGRRPSYFEIISELYGDMGVYHEVSGCKGRP